MVVPDSLVVSLGERSYPIYIANNFSGFCTCLKEAGIGLEQKLVVITDENVDSCHGAGFLEELKSSGYKAEKYVLAPGERSKNLETIQNIYRFLINSKLDRKSALIALGGGVVGDITGFAASTFLRGINFIQVPTSLLAQVDSSVGGKTGVDFDNVKNIIGTFYQPKMVYINVNSLKTLPPREFISGMAEVIKHGIIRNADFFNYIKDHLDEILNYNENVMRHVIKANCSIKSDVVEQDERESGLRAILNFGHTIGHAVESVSDFELLHGECVSIGIVGAFKIACYLGMISAETVDDIAALLEKTGLPTSVKNLNPDKVYEKMLYDKKAKGGRLLFVLPRAVGDVILRFIDDDKLIMKVLTEIIV